MRGAFADGSRVASARVARGLTQEHLAALANLDVKTVRKAEQGKCLDMSTLSQLAVALDVDLYRLIRESEIQVDLQLARREVVLSWQRTFDVRDIDGLVALFHEDAILHLPGGPDLPFGGTFRGKAEIRRCQETAWATCETEPVPAEDFSLIASGDTVVLRGVKGIRLPSGEVVRLWAVHIFTFKEARIIELRVEFDTLKFNQLLQISTVDP